ncbi:hypothetical protein JD77_02462 [Micromonospora olivasterospora]|uniref:Uncharacterized protein n=1 Tax=Micromonospora olivasterospora TaxID=1880 RepID=A0A562I8Z5_MICOL|nr:hypothetical protein JD77_02462 [Micromonospora olivasterospora]
MAPPPDKPGDESGASDKPETVGADKPTSATAPVGSMGGAAGPGATQPIKAGGGQAPGAAVTGTLPRLGLGPAKPPPDGARSAGTSRPVSGGDCRRGFPARPPSGRARG